MVAAIKKLKLSNSPSTSRFEFGDARHVLRARLRFQNKKPLCLQYNLSASQKTKKVLQKMKRRNCDSLSKVLIPYLISLFCSFLDFNYKIMEFLFKPVEELNLRPVSPHLPQVEVKTICAPPENQLSRQSSTSTISSSKKESPKPKKLAIKNDFGRTARIQSQKNKLAEFLVFP